MNRERNYTPGLGISKKPPPCAANYLCYLAPPSPRPLRGMKIPHLHLNGMLYGSRSPFLKDVAGIFYSIELFSPKGHSDSLRAESKGIRINQSLYGDFPILYPSAASKNFCPRVERDRDLEVGASTPSFLATLCMT